MDLNKSFSLKIGAILLISIISASSIYYIRNHGSRISEPVFQNKLVLMEAFPKLFYEGGDANGFTFLASPKDNTNRIFVSELQGRIFVFENKRSVSEYEIFLDLSDKVTLDGETGLFTFAFHPEFANNGYFYVSYVDVQYRSIISRYTVDLINPNVVDPNTEFIIFSLEQPSLFHNGGQILFDEDGYLYISLGDGGYSDEFEPDVGGAQDRTNLFGSILRIDVDTPANGLNYSIPLDNPYYDNSFQYREEIFAHGFRNPWRMSYDSINSQFWVGDVGSIYYEEINLIDDYSIGENYGWPVMEGNNCYPYSQAIEECNQNSYELPIVGYEHSGWRNGWSITGGYVYRGEQFPQFYGKYFFSDFLNRTIWIMNSTGEPNLEILELEIYPDASALVNLLSFGVDEKSELYFLTNDGVIYTLGLI